MSTSSLSEVSPDLVSFDYEVRGEKFGYEFTRHFGDREEAGPPSEIRVHVALLASRGPEALGSAVSFSFPLCGYAQDDWSSGEAMRFLSRQVVEFSHHVSHVECTDLLGTFWSLAKFGFFTGSSPGVRHMLVYLIVDSRVPPCYVYIHEPGLQEMQVFFTATRLWRDVCCTLGELLVRSTGRRDWDYSPSKPASKVARMAARAASFFASSP